MAYKTKQEDIYIIRGLVWKESDKGRKVDSKGNQNALCVCVKLNQFL